MFSVFHLQAERLARILFIYFKAFFSTLEYIFYEYGVIFTDKNLLCLQKKKSALFEMAEVIPVMTNDYKDSIMKGVQVQKLKTNIKWQFLLILLSSWLTGNNK